MNRFSTVVCTLILSLGMAHAKTQTLTWDSLPLQVQYNDAINPPQRTQWFDVDKSVLFQDHVSDLIATTMGACKGFNSSGTVDVHVCGALQDNQGHPVHDNSGQTVPEKPNFPGKDDYVIIHVMKWKDLAAGSTVQEVDKQNWYVYSGQSDWDSDAYQTTFRIFGKKKFYLLYIHLNRAQAASYNIRYTVTATSKIPAFLDHFVSLGQLAGIGAVGGATPTQVADVWGAHLFEVDYVPSDISIAPTVMPNTGATVSLDSKKFDNEGKYHIDFSVGVPIKKLSELSFSQSNNTLVPTKVDKTNLFMLFDYYPVAFDIKSSGWSKYPHLVAGVAMDNKPLQKSLIAVGYGPVLAHFYAGVLIHTQRLPRGAGCGSVSSGMPVQSAVGLTNKTCPEFSFGLNVAVGAIAETLKGKGK